MRKWIVSVMLSGCMISLASCGNNTGRNSTTSVAVTEAKSIENNTGKTEEVSDKKEDPIDILYMKDNELFYRPVSSSESVQLTSSMFNDYPYAEEVLHCYPSLQQQLSFYCRQSEDGKTIFFPDDMIVAEENEKFPAAQFSLWYYSADEKTDPVKIDYEVASGGGSAIRYGNPYSIPYEIDREGTRVIYVQGDDIRFQYDVKKQDRKALLFNSYMFYAADEELYLPDTGNSGYCRPTSGELCKITVSGNVEIVDSNIGTLWSISDNGEIVVYDKDDVLYEYNGNEIKQITRGNVQYVYKVYNSGEIYYSLEDRSEMRNFIEGDIQADAAQSLLKNIDLFEHVYYFDGSESNDMGVCFSVSVPFPNGNHGVILEVISNAENVKKINLEGKDNWIDKDSGDYVEIVNEIFKNIRNQAQISYYYADKGKKILMGDLRPYKIRECPEERAWYCMTPNNRENLYKINIDDDVISSADIYADGISLYWMMYNDGRLIYFENAVSNNPLYDGYGYGTGDLYVDGIYIDSNVEILPNCWCYNNLTQELYYISEWDEDDQSGVLHVYKDGNIIKIDEDVYAVQKSISGAIVYLKGYDETVKGGDLYVYEKGKSVLLDSKVMFPMLTYTQILEYEQIRKRN